MNNNIAMYSKNLWLIMENYGNLSLEENNVVHLATLP
jgi:hypothetical protein